MGKTRLALAYGQRVARAVSEQGVYFVPIGCRRNSVDGIVLEIIESIGSRMLPTNARS